MPVQTRCRLWLIEACHGFNMALSLVIALIPSTTPDPWQKQMCTHTLAAHLVTLRPSFKQSTSPLPALSVLHCMKSSLKGLHRAPMKKEAERRGAEEAPTSVTAGMEAGRGVVSTKTVWLNLRLSVLIRPRKGIAAAEGDSFMH
jgi:hypothetical protein